MAPESKRPTKVALHLLGLRRPECKRARVFEVNGVTNTKLMMKAYGYEKGVANIKYSYYEVKDTANVAQEPSVDFLFSANAAQHKTTAYKDVPKGTLVVRRADTVKIVVRHPSSIRKRCHSCNRRHG